MTVTIKDVALKADVSVSTVSLVLNNNNAVKHETRYKVLNAIKELGYTPNDYARSLVTKRKKIIGVVKIQNIVKERSYTFDAMEESFLHDTLKGIDREIMRSDYSLLSELFTLNPGTGEIPELVDRNKVDGILIMGGLFDEMCMGNLIQKKIPIVLVGGRYPKIDYVDTDEGAGIYKAAMHLIENGHKDIVYINGPDISITSGLKLPGFLKALEERGLPARSDWIVNANFTGLDAYNAMKDLWGKGIRPTAVLAASDCMTIGALRFLYEQGVRCPDDISAVGYQDGLLAEYSIPPLTSIRIHKEQMGTEACKILINRLKNPKSKPINLTIEPELIVRGSVRSV